MEKSDANIIKTSEAAEQPKEEENTMLVVLKSVMSTLSSSMLVWNEHTYLVVTQIREVIFPFYQIAFYPHREIPT
jgi:hypothetical protein